MTAVLSSVPAAALSLTEAIGLARRGDPAYLTAYANVEAARGRAEQAFGAQLPQLTLNVGTNNNRRDYETLDSPFPAAQDGYNSKNAQLNLTLPLYRRAVNIAYDQSEVAFQQTYIQLQAADQDLLVRLSQAWFDWMLARDMLVCAEGQSAAMRHQHAHYAHALKIGLVSAPVEAEARYKHDAAIAEQLVAEADLDLKLAALEQVIGAQRAPRPPALADRYASDAMRAELQRRSLAQWLEHAENDSPTVRAALRGLEAASVEIDKQRAGHEPTLDLVGNVGTNGQRAGSFPGQNGYQIKQRAIGVQLTVPIFTGGTTSGKVTEAVALREKARHELEQARRGARLAARQAWAGWQSGLARRAASEQAVVFGRAALTAAEAGERNELKSPLDVLQARQQLLGALRDTQRARYDMITSHFKLLASAGRLRASDLAALDAFLTGDAADAALLAEARASVAAARLP